MSELMLDRVVNALFEALGNHTVEGTGQTLTLQGGKLEIDLTCDARAVARELVESLRPLTFEAQVAVLEGTEKHLRELEETDRLDPDKRLVLTVYAQNGKFVQAGHEALIDAIVAEQA